MADLKTKQTEQSVTAFVAAVEDDTRRRDCEQLVGIMQDIIGETPKMWGSSIVGCGSYHYTYATGREGDTMLAGFSPRKASLTLYIAGGFEPHADLMAKLGKYKLGKGCLYISKLADVDTSVLRQLITASVTHIHTLYPPQS